MSGFQILSKSPEFTCRVKWGAKHLPVKSQCVYEVIFTKQVAAHLQVVQGFLSMKNPKR